MAIVLALKVDPGKPIRRGSAYMWKVVRGLTEDDRAQPFTVDEVLDLTNGTEASTVRKWLKTLVRAGIVAVEGDTYHLLRRPVMLPHVSNDGRIVSVGQDALWTAIRALKEFTPRELAVAATTEEHAVTEWTAKSYVKTLLAAGYLTVTVAGHAHRQASYRLRPTMNTGPLAPKILRAKFVFDPNRNEVIGQAEAEEVSP